MNEVFFSLCVHIAGALEGCAEDGGHGAGDVERRRSGRWLCRIGWLVLGGRAAGGNRQAWLPV
eukprot:6326232-Alexandrium_andersonii.AAC.1